VTDGESPLPRIAYLTGEFPRATDTFIQREVAGLRQAGFAVDTFAVRRPGAEHLVGPEQREGQASTTYLLELARSSKLLTANLAMLTRRPIPYVRALALAWSTKRAGFRGGLFQLVYFLEAVLLADEIRQRGVQHLHNHFGDSSCTVAMLASEVGGFPYSFTLHGPGIFFEPHTWRLDAKVERAAFVSCISHFARSQAAIFAPTAADTLHIVHCGIEPGRLEPVTHHGRARRLAYVGRVIEMKGLGVVFEAMKRIDDQLSPPLDQPLEITVIGDGPDRAALERRAVEAGLGSRVDFVGAKSQAEVAELLATADIFVMPSFAEGVPVVVMEALGTGLPVVASFVGGMAELVDDGVNGHLVPPGDADALAARLMELIDDPSARQQMGDAGRATVTAEFNAAVEARRLGSLFVASLAGDLSPTRPEVASGSGGDRPQLT
jgi:glycosyltransferase involved in cell wall biosynthesis